MHTRSKKPFFKNKIAFNYFSKMILVLRFCITITFIIMSIIFSFRKINKSENFLTSKILNKEDTFILIHDSFLKTQSGDKVFVQFATTNEDKERGLSGKNKLNDKEGMFFIFENPGVQNFWMKDMNFDIDMIWLDDTGDLSPLRGDSLRSKQGGLKIVHIEKNAEAKSYNKSNPNLSKRFSNSDDKDHLAKYVLEINAGLSDKMNLKEGDIMLKY